MCAHLSNLPDQFDSMFMHSGSLLSVHFSPSLHSTSCTAVGPAVAAPAGAEVHPEQTQLRMHLEFNWLGALLE